MQIFRYPFLFGDLFILCKQNDKYINLDISSYGEIFSLMCGGFDDCETSEESLFIGIVVHSIGRLCILIVDDLRNY